MLIALKADGAVYLAYNLSDLPVQYFDRKDFVLPDNVPLWKVKSGCIMGTDGEALDEADLIRYDARLFRGEIDMYNLLENIAPSIVEKLGLYKKLKKDGNMQSGFIIAQGGKGYRIYGKGECEELDECFCLGSYGEVALSSLDITRGLPPIERIKRTYGDVEASSCIPAYPIAVMDTKTQKLRIIEKA